MSRRRIAIAFVVTAAVGFGPLSPTVASKPAGASAAKATRATFAGLWIGHTRHLRITKKGRAKESIDDGCCTHVIDLRLKLSHPRGGAKRASIRARVTAVDVHKKSYYSRRNPAPKVGQTARLRLRNGVIHEPFTKTVYCDEKAGAAGKCGA